MNRIELIKAAARKLSTGASAKPKGMHATAHPDEATPARKIDRVRTSGVLMRGSWGPINRPKGLLCDWVHEADTPKPVEVRTGRTKRKSYVTRIAEKWLHAPKR